MRSRTITWRLSFIIGISLVHVPLAHLRAETSSRLVNYSNDRTANAVLVAPALVKLPAFDEATTALAEQEENQPSPSDQAATDESKDRPANTEENHSAGKEARSDKSDSQQREKANTELLSPLQNRQLTLKVQAVSISPEKIGTGVIPEASRPKWSSLTDADRGELRNDLYTHVFWQASKIQHYPLYFEDAMLERHGHTRCCHGCEITQSVISGVKFFGTIAFLPYLRTLQPKHQCVYSLGHYRAGSAAPCLRSHLPYDFRAAIVESAGAAAFFWATPL